ncbi:MAG: Na/Pi symporter [Alcanivoracaceae bacterium]|nr:Na/Pi symporter [Alcanivoracaceae bacterium]
MSILVGFVAGLGLFLFAMQQIEQAVQSLFSEKAAGMLQRATATPMAGILSGALITAIMQSSSLVGLLVLAFVAAGVLQLRHAMAIMLGANVGTTLTGWLVALLGFTLSLSAISLPLAGAGGLVCILLPKGRWHSLGLLMLAFGLLVFGLDNMKLAAEGVALRFDVSWLQGYPPLAYTLVGTLLTAVIQSSSATMLITLSALHGGVIGFPEALALVIGADLGTTMTLLLGVIKGSAEKMQVAAFHVLYNLATAVLAFLFLLPWWPGIAAALGISDPLFALVAFHSGFNLLGIFLFAPFLKPIGSWIRKHVGHSAQGDLLTEISPETVEPALILLEQQSSSLLTAIEEQCRAPLACGSLEQFQRDYQKITDGELLLAEYANRLARQAMNERQVERLGRVRRGVSEGVYALKSIKDVVADLYRLAHCRQPSLADFYLQVSAHLAAFYRASNAEQISSAQHEQKMDALLRQAYQIVALAREQGVSVLNLAREVDESGRHWLRSQALAEQNLTAQSASA